MALLAGGASNAKIAETLFVTPNTVRTHLVLQQRAVIGVVA
jgi:DNA-binding CsgD family transcriptional regulator